MSTAHTQAAAMAAAVGAAVPNAAAAPAVAPAAAATAAAPVGAFVVAAAAALAGAVARAVVAALAALPLSAMAAPFLPRSGAEVLETLPRRSNDAALRQQRAQMAAAPRDPVQAAALAQRYIEQGRAHSDPRYFGQAQAVLAPWWQAAAPPVPILLLRATLLQSSHRFDEAVRDLEAVTRAAPSNPQAWLTLATVQVVRGEYSAAVRSCGRLSSLASQLASIACLANARAANGQLAASEHLLALAVARSGAVGGERGGAGDSHGLAGVGNAGDAGDADSAGAEAVGLRVWALTLLGEFAERRSDAVSAEARFRQALILAPDDSYLLGAFADFLLDQQRNVEVQQLLRPYLRIDSLLLRHAIAVAAATPRALSMRSAPSVAELQARFDAAARRGDTIHQREQARFELHLRHNPRAALALAQANWQVQKERADLRILLEAALAARAPAAASAALAWRRQHGLQDRIIDQLARQLEGAPL